MKRTPRPGVPSAAHFDRPADVAAHIASQSAIVIAGADTDRTAMFAVAIARAAAADRRVALADLVGELAPVYALAGGEDAKGITDCFRDELALTEVARPVPEMPSLFVLPSGDRVRTEPSLVDAERWTRLVRGFGEAGGLLILITTDRSHLLKTLGDAGATLIYAGPPEMAPTDITLSATIGAALPKRPAKSPRTGVPVWAIAAAALVAIVAGGGAAVAWTRATNAPDGSVVVVPTRRADAPITTATSPGATPLTIAMVEPHSSDSARAAPFSVRLVAANTAANANSMLSAALRDVAMPAATISVVTMRGGAAGSRATRWHTVMAGAWREAREADSVLAALRREGVVEDGGGEVVRAPFGVMIADSASRERARAVIEVWRAKGVVPYALTQDDGTVRVYAGAFETVAQAVTMTAMVQAAGGAPIVAYRTGRPD